MRKGGGFQSHNIFDVLEETHDKDSKKGSKKNSDPDDEDEVQAYYCLEISGLPLFVEKIQFLPIASGFGKVTHIDCDKPGFAYIFYDEKHVATKTLMSMNGKRYQGKRMTVQFANKALPAAKKCYHCDQFGHFGIDCKEGPLASMPEEIIALFCSFISTKKTSVAPMKVNRKWKRAIQTHTSYIATSDHWPALYDCLSNINSITAIHTVIPKLDQFPKLNSLIIDIDSISKFLSSEDALLPPLKHLTITHAEFYSVSLQLWRQITQLISLETLSLKMHGAELQLKWQDITHLSNLRHLDFACPDSPKNYLQHFTKLEHLGCANALDLTLQEARMLTNLTSFANMDRYYGGVLSQVQSSYTWLADLQIKSLTVKNIDENFNIKLWPNLESLSIAHMMSLPDNLEFNPSLKELTLDLGSIGRFTKLGELTNLESLTIHSYTAANSLFLDIVKLTKLRRLDVRMSAVFPAIDDTKIGIAELPYLAHLSLATDIEFLNFLFWEEISSLESLKSLTISAYDRSTRNPHWIDAIKSLTQLTELQLRGTLVHNHHAPSLRNKLKRTDTVTINGVPIQNIKSCSCADCLNKESQQSMDRYAVDPAPIVMAMEDHMLDVYEIRDGRSDDREKKLKKHDKTKLQRIEKQGNLTDKEQRKRRNRRK